MSPIRMPKAPPTNPDDLFDDAPPPRWIRQATEDRDSLHLSRLYPSSNDYGIPDLPKATLDMVPEHLIAYRDRPRNALIDFSRWAVHFYLDDYRFGGAWSKPWQTLRALNEKYQFLLTPDFSLYWQMPYAMKLWNVYRNRWVGAFWSENGSVNVIPSISWAGPDSYPYTFLGVPRGSVVAMRGIGVNPNGSEWERWLPGYHAMLRALDPALIVVYGRMPEELHQTANIRQYDTRWQEIAREARQQRKKKKALAALGIMDRR